MRILIIEDEKKTAAFLKQGLSENGFVVDVAENGMDGLFLAGSQSFDLFILDVGLPKLDGWQVLSTLRSQGVTTPALFLTARDLVSDRVKGLELGADDYLVKPFAFSELLARVRTLLRRGLSRPVEHLAIADLEIDLPRHKVSRAGQRIDLTTQEFTLLVLLLRRQGEVLSRTIIAEQVWDMNFDSDTNVVDVAIRRLRRKIDDPFEHKLIHTIRGTGYVLEPR
ncbi:MAG: heavy metal response regulator transcription factor [Gammaproteobacteria bacterium]|nr:heavy metal response regulator transcription factor [Gammaproteobacteria bacterium]